MTDDSSWPVPAATVTDFHIDDGSRFDAKRPSRELKNRAALPIPRYTLSRMHADSSQDHIVTGNPFGPVPFHANVELLRLFLTHREDIVESIEAVLNAQRKPIRYLQDHLFCPAISRIASSHPLRPPPAKHVSEANSKKRIGPRDSGLVRFRICITT